MRSEGTLVKWDDERGFGFIRPADGGKDVFVHITGFPYATGRPDVGESVSYEIEQSDRGPRATRVMSLRTIKRSSARATQNEDDTSAPMSVAEILLACAFMAAILCLAAVRLVPWAAVLLYAVISLATFLLFMYDKQSAQSGDWRVSEKLLLAFSFYGGWPGGLLAQQVFRHKTAKPSFRVLFALVVVANVAALVAWSIAFVNPPHAQVPSRSIEDSVWIDE